MNTVLINTEILVCMIFWLTPFGMSLVCHVAKQIFVSENYFL